MRRRRIGRFRIACPPAMDLRDRCRRRLGSRLGFAHSVTRRRKHGPGESLRRDRVGQRDRPREIGFHRAEARHSNPRWHVERHRRLRRRRRETRPADHPGRRGGRSLSRLSWRFRVRRCTTGGRDFRSNRHGDGCLAGSGRSRCRLRGDPHRHCGLWSRGHGGRGCRARRDRCGRGGRTGGNARRQKRERVEIALIVGRQSDAEVHIRLSEVDRSARPDCPDCRRLGHALTSLDRDRAEMEECRRVTVSCLDRHGLASVRNRACERHDPSRRRKHGRIGWSAEIDTAMLTSRIGVRVVERERSQDGAVDRPRPRSRL